MFCVPHFELKQSLSEAEKRGKLGLRAANAVSSGFLFVVDLGLPECTELLIVGTCLFMVDGVIHCSVGSVPRREEKVRLLDLGVDDYIVKRSGMAELLACVP